MKLLKQGICLAVLASTTLVAPGIQAAAAPGDDRSLIAKLRSDADGAVKVSDEPATGKVGFVRASRNGDLLPRSRANAVAKADAYLDEYAGVFGARRAELGTGTARRDAYGTTVTYEQEYQGLPVWGAVLKAHVNKEGDLTSVNGSAVPDLDLDVTPRLTATEAAERAVRTVEADPPGHEGETADTAGIEAATTELMVYRTGLVKGEAGENLLAYRVEVTNERNVRDIVFVDAGTGKPVNRYSMVHDALDRVLYEWNDGSPAIVWEEGDPLPGALNADQENLVEAAGDTYWLFANAFGRDSFDGEGATMVTLNNAPISCPNASWNGSFTQYCDGVTSDDIVAHEWAHAYTQYTHGLIYQWQPGALNEAYSDIIGETVDLINGRDDAGEGDLTQTRTVGVCSEHSPALPIVTIDSPASIAKDCATGGAGFGPQLDATGISGEVALGTSADETTLACDANPITADLTGKIGLVDRGTCAFTEKAANVEAAGAIAVVIGNSEDAVFTMGGSDPGLTVPSVMIGKTDRDSIVATLPDEPVQISMKDSGGAREDSYRWLIGEQSSGFGGAIRDMWSPTCYGDPGKVTDAEYKCSEDDNGGVHSNSGVPNHGYALLVDGGTYNGRTIEGIGLDKAAAIYYRSMAEYQTPTSDFADHADSLAASCADLTGQPINRLSTVPEDVDVLDEQITATDCAQVDAMAAAVELRTEPAACDFQPLLSPGQFNPCGPDQARHLAFGDDFEDGLGAWTIEGDAPFYEGSANLDWVASSDLPGGRSGSGAYAPDPIIGSCDEGADDVTGRTTMTSPAIELPAGAKHQAPSLDFWHYVATEAGWDGGNVKVSVNGGAFEVVPNGAYLHNAPNSTLLPAAAGNSNPLAGEDAFTGSDGGVLQGSWGQSVVDLTMIGAAPGDTVQVRFDMGRDGCNGLDGWYVDDVEVFTCVDAITMTATQVPSRSTYGDRARVDVTLAAAGSGAPVPTGTIAVTDRAGTVLGQATIANGAASVALPADLGAGRHTLVATYSGDDNYGQQSADVDVRVARAKPRMTVTVKPKKPRSTKPLRFKVLLESAITPSGKVRVIKGGKVLGRGTLSRSGKVTIKIPKRLVTRGRHVFKVKYPATSSYKKVRRMVRVRVR